MNLANLESEDSRLPNLVVEGHFLSKCRPEVLAHEMQIQSITMLITHPPFERQHLKGEAAELRVQSCLQITVSFLEEAREHGGREGGRR